MEILVALKDTPIPTLLVLGGLLFLFLGIATLRKPIVIDVPSKNRKIALVLGTVLLISGLYLAIRPVPDQAGVDEPILGDILTPSETDVTTDTSVRSEQTTPTFLAQGTESISAIPTVVYASQEEIHLGDENISTWAPLSGECLLLKIKIDFPVQDIQLSFETFGLTDRAVVKVNDNEVSIIPPVGTENQEQWSERRSLSLSPNYFVDGYNILEICAPVLTKNASYPGEKDDFQIRNLVVTSQ